MLTRFNDSYFVSNKVSFKLRFQEIPALHKENTALHISQKTMVKRVGGGQSGLKVIVSVILTILNACHLVGKRVSFKSRFHKRPALYKENGALHIPQKNNDREGQGSSIGVESSLLSDVDDGDITMALNS